ncbi:MFS transporter [Micromonospora sp. KC213]|uniref:MFS transporter n=1 Tax=Micromonospora sp. KC213 TaxID=2530378 RepID=UPI00105332EC|nr:MFS transporter [Micromonospora sp. KC213]TDC44247.1 MFS transporter [Micromonospora sp. KC213]
MTAPVVTETSSMRLRRAGALVSLAVTAFCYVAMETLPIGILPLVSADLNVSMSMAGTLVTGYAVVVAVVSLPLTYATRRIPRRRLMSTLLALLVVATVVSATAPTYGVLLGARVVIAITQALFWAVAAPAAAGMFPVHVRGRVMSVVFSGAALGPMLGVPAGTWLGQQAGWRVAFLALASLALVAFLAIVMLMPSVPPEQEHAATGTNPEAHRYAIVIITTALSVAGLFTAFTYTSVFLTTVSGLPAAALSAVLLARGVADFIGISAGGWATDRHQRLAVIVPLALLAAAHLGMFWLAEATLPVAVLLSLTGFAMGALTPALSNRVMEVAPGRTDVASAGNSAAYNVGIAAGSLLGGIVLPALGVRATALVGGIVLLLALAVALAETGVATTAARRTSPVGGNR